MLVFLCSGSPRVCLRMAPKPFGAFAMRGAAGLLRSSENLRLPKTNTTGRALFPFAVPAALRSASTAPRALTVSLRSSGSRHASPAALRLSPLAGCGAACGVSLRPSEPFGLLGHSFCHSRTRLRGHRLRRESRESDLPPPLLFHNTVSPSRFTIAERCHSDGAAQRRRGISVQAGQ